MAAKKNCLTQERVTWRISESLLEGAREAWVKMEEAIGGLLAIEKSSEGAGHVLAMLPIDPISHVCPVA